MRHSRIIAATLAIALAFPLEYLVFITYGVATKGLGYITMCPGAFGDGPFPCTVADSLFGNLFWLIMFNFLFALTPFVIAALVMYLLIRWVLDR